MRGQEKIAELFPRIEDKEIIRYKIEDSFGALLAAQAEKGQNDLSEYFSLIDGSLHYYARCVDIAAKMLLKYDTDQE